jgi:Ca2+-transporting ATPase
LIAFHIPIVALAVLAPLSGTPLLLLPIHLVWLEVIVHPVSALVFQAESATSSVMRRPPRDPAEPMLPRPALARSVLSGGALALASFAAYWWQWQSLGEPQARAVALVVLLAGYQTLIFAERLALPALALEAIPRTPVFWTVWCGTTLSLAGVLYLPPVARMFRVEPPAETQLLTAVIVGALVVGWRLVGGKRGLPAAG